MVKLRLRSLMPVLAIGMAISLLIIVLPLHGSANVSLSYGSNDTIPPDSLVSLVNDSNTSVELANLGNSSRLLGVAVPTDQSLSGFNSANNTQVAVSGVTEALVSTINGDIHPGDPITASALDGVGMKGANAGTKTIGISSGLLTSKSNNTVALDINGKNGGTQRVYMGHITINIVSNYPTSTGANQGPTGFLGFLETSASTVSGHHVTELQAILAFVTAVVTLLILLTLMYAMIRGGLISIGRNPLAKVIIFRTLEELVALSIAILVMGAAIIYFILR
jgi:hypothetical protein